MGHLANGTVLNVKQVGMAVVCNVTQVRSIDDLYRILGPSLNGLGLLSTLVCEYIFLNFTIPCLVKIRGNIIPVGISPYVVWVIHSTNLVNTSCSVSEIE